VVDLSELSKLGKVAGVPGIALGVVACIVVTIVAATETLSDPWRGPIVMVLVIGAILLVGLTLVVWSSGRTSAQVDRHRAGAGRALVGVITSLAVLIVAGLTAALFAHDALLASTGAPGPRIETRQDSALAPVGYIGLVYKDLDAETAQHIGWRGNDHPGALVVSVVTGGPADSANIRKQDLIIRCGSRAISDSSTLKSCVDNSSIGEHLELVLFRDGDIRTTHLTVGQR
jgi:hypothetical protein